MIHLLLLCEGECYLQDFCSPANWTFSSRYKQEQEGEDIIQYRLECHHHGCLILFIFATIRPMLEKITTYLLYCFNLHHSYDHCCYCNVCVLVLIVIPFVML